MNKILYLLWGLSGMLAWLALGVTLFGLVVASAAVIRHLQNDPHDPHNDALPAGIWQGRNVRAGMGIFAVGLSLLVLDILIRLLLPAHHHF